MKISALIFAFTVAACTGTQNPETVASDKTAQNDASGNSTATTQDADATINSMTYDAASHSLTMKLTYSGCKDATFSFKIDVCATSYPGQCGAVLQINKDHKTDCAGINDVDYVQKLDAGLDASYVTISNKSKQSKSVLVDKTGNVAKNVMPPPSSDGSAQAGATEQSEATISELTYDKGTHSVSMKLQYRGCADATHKLQFSEFCAESYPMQCGAVLLREKGYDATCKKAITESFTYKLQDNFDTSVLTINAKESKASILVDRFGKVPAATKP